MQWFVDSIVVGVCCVTVSKISLFHQFVTLLHWVKKE